MSEAATIIVVQFVKLKLKKCNRIDMIILKIHITKNILPGHSSVLVPLTHCRICEHSGSVPHPGALPGWFSHAESLGRGVPPSTVAVRQLLVRFHDSFASTGLFQPIWIGRPVAFCFLHVFLILLHPLHWNTVISA